MPFTSAFDVKCIYNDESFHLCIYLRGDLSLISINLLGKKGTVITYVVSAVNVISNNYLTLSEELTRQVYLFSI